MECNLRVCWTVSETKISYYLGIDEYVQFVKRKTTRSMFMLQKMSFTGLGLGEAPSSVVGNGEEIREGAPPASFFIFLGVGGPCSLSDALMIFLH